MVAFFTALGYGLGFLAIAAIFVLIVWWIDHQSEMEEWY
jgi:hypothetical protein